MPPTDSAAAFADGKPTTSSLERAAQAWCEPTTQTVPMSPELATVFARMLDEAKARAFADGARAMRNYITGKLLEWSESDTARDVSELPLPATPEQATSYATRGAGDWIMPTFA
mgnify:CR=1 FL=1